MPTLISLDDYVTTDRASAEQIAALRHALKARLNIIICGAPESGKTTLINALLHEMALLGSQQKFVILEYVRQLQCEAENCLRRCVSEHMPMQRLLAMALTLKPDHLIVDDVKAEEALDILRLWSTGKGGVCALQSPSAPAAVEQLFNITLAGDRAGKIDVIVPLWRRHDKAGCLGSLVTAPE